MPRKLTAVMFTRCSPQFRDRVVAVLLEGENVNSFVRAAVEQALRARESEAMRAAADARAVRAAAGDRFELLELDAAPAKEAM